MTINKPAVTRDPDPEMWDEFVASVDGDVLSQSTSWARVKASGYEAHVVALTEGGKVVAGCQLLSRSVGPLRLAYAPNGPLFTEGRADLIPAMLRAVGDTAKRLRLNALVLHPASVVVELESALEAAGFGPAPVSISTPATVLVDLSPDPEALLAGMSSSRRRNIRKAERAGVVVRRGRRDELSVFQALHASTAERQGFTAMTMSYLQQQAEILPGIFEIYFAELDGEPLAAASITRFGDRAVFKLAGLSDDKDATKARPSDYLHWRIMLDVKEAGSRYYDFGGFDRVAAQSILRGDELPEEFRSGASQFKLAFGGQPVVLPEAVWKLSPRPLSQLQDPLTWIFHRAAFLRRALAAFRAS